MNDHLISRSRFLDALVLDADNKTDLIQVHQALEKAVISPDDVRGAGEWEDNYPILVELECLRCKNCNKLVQIGRYCANCGERKKGAETWIKKKSRSQST